MISLTDVVVSVVLVTVTFALCKIVPILYGVYTSGVRNLPGPPAASWLWGNLRQIIDAENSVLQEQWVKEYGPNIVYRGFLGSYRFTTFDTRALNHIMTHSATYQKPEQARKAVEKTFGKGILFTEGEQHRQQRRILNPAFGPAQVRELTEIFIEKAMELRDVWTADIEREAEKGVARINVFSGLTNATLDIIGLAGFSYAFDSLSGKEGEMNRAVRALFEVPQKITAMMMARNVLPVLNTIFPDKRTRQADEARRVLRQVGTQLIAQKKAAILAQMAEKKLGMERKDVIGRDLLTLLLKANMATDVPDSQRLSDDDVFQQVPTFVLAGHETTSSATTWALYALTQDPAVQRKLREELLAVETESPTMDELAALPYLDAVVRETLRLHAPVPSTIRVATEDDVIPVSAPYFDRYGKQLDHIQISKGTPIIIPILAINRSKELWGEDAMQFNPARWEAVPESVSSIPGVWGHMMTFIAGPRACIGYRFSLIEMKALLFTLVRAFEFELAVPSEDIMKKSVVVQRPLLRSAPEQGSQMPLLVRPYRRT